MSQLEIVAEARHSASRSSMDGRSSAVPSDEPAGTAGEERCRSNYLKLRIEDHCTLGGYFGTAPKMSS